MKLSGPENVIPDIFSDYEYWSFLTQQYSCIIVCICPCREKRLQNMECRRENRRGTIVTSWWSAGVSTEKNRQSIYILKVLQLENNSSGSAKKTSINKLAKKHIEKSSTVKFSVKFLQWFWGDLCANQETFLYHVSNHINSGSNVIKIDIHV